MRRSVPFSTCICFAIGWLAFDVARDCLSQESVTWNAFASAESEPVPVEGKKNRDRKHPDDIEPTPAPAPDPDAKPEPIPKRPDSKPHVVKPAKPEKPDHSKPDGGHHNGDKIITNVVYKTSWIPVLIAYAWLVILSFRAFVQARKSGLGLGAFLTFWKRGR